MYILKETGLMDILGTVMSPVMGLFGLPGEAFAVLISAFFAKPGCATAASMYEAGALTLGQDDAPTACILMGTLIGHYARIVLVTDTNKKWHPLLIAVCLLDAAISLSSCASFWRQWAFSKRRQSLCFPSYRVGAAFSSSARQRADHAQSCWPTGFPCLLQDGFVLTTAIISAVLLTIGIRVVKRHDEEKSELILSGVSDTRTAQIHPSWKGLLAGFFLFSPFRSIYYRG